MPHLLSQLVVDWSLDTLPDAFSLMCQDLITHMSANPPIFLDSMASPYAFEGYRDKLTAPDYRPERMLVLKSIMDNVFARDLSFIPLNLEAIRKCSGIENIEKMKAAQQRLFLMRHALLFSVTKIGNCADRAAYAALVLFKALEGTGIKVGLQSLKTKDQFYVCLGHAEKGWKIYDPLTNPSLVFDFAEYQAHMLPYFPEYSRPKHPFKLMITPAIYAQYTAQREQAPVRIRDSLRTHDAVQLWRDPEYKDFLVSKGIRQDLLTEAHHQLLALCEADIGEQSRCMASSGIK